MTDLNRREFGTAMAALVAAMSGVTSAQAQVNEEPTLSKFEVYPYAKLPVKTAANGNESRAVMHGTLPTGEFVEVHETTLQAGQMPHPPHRHRHSELILMRSGTLEAMNEGVGQRVGPGDVVFMASGVLHGVKNVGAGPAMYFVVAVGQQVAEG